MKKDKVFKFIKIYLFIALILAIILYINLFKDNDKPFLKSGWETCDELKFYHYFYKNDNGYTIKTYDKYHDLISVNETGVLNKNKMTFDDTNGSTDIYIYKKNLIYVFDIDRNGVKTELFPLERIQDD